MGDGDVQPGKIGKASCSGSSLGGFGTSEGIGLFEPFELPSLNSISIVVGSDLMLPTITSIVSYKVSAFDNSAFTVVPGSRFNSPLSVVVPGLLT